jgi:hypothetical protein
MKMIPLDFETVRRRAWLARWHAATVESRARAAGWAAIVVFVFLGAAR